MLHALHICHVYWTLISVTAVYRPLVELSHTVVTLVCQTQTWLSWCCLVVGVMLRIDVSKGMLQTENHHCPPQARNSWAFSAQNPNLAIMGGFWRASAYRSPQQKGYHGSGGLAAGLAVRFGSTAACFQIEHRNSHSKDSEGTP